MTNKKKLDNIKLILIKKNGRLHEDYLLEKGLISVINKESEV